MTFTRSELMTFPRSSTEFDFAISPKASALATNPSADLTNQFADFPKQRLVFLALVGAPAIFALPNECRRPEFIESRILESGTLDPVRVSEQILD